MFETTKTQETPSFPNILPTVEKPETAFPAQFRRRRSKIQANREPRFQNMPTSIQKTGILFDRAVENPDPITGRAQGAIASAQKSTRTFSTAARLPWWRPEGRLIDLQPDGRN
jgi:hypothetical protein